MFDLKTLSLTIKQISEEKGIPENKVIEAIEMAIAAAYKKEYAKKGEIIRAKLDLKTGEVKFWQVKLVVDSSMIKNENEAESFESKEGEEKKKIKFNPDKHIMLEEACQLDKNIAVGAEMLFPLSASKEFSRIAAQTAKQVILQRLHEAERDFIISEFKGKETQIISGIIQRIEGKNIYIDLGKAVGVMFMSESIPGERYRIGDRKKFLILAIEDKPRGPLILLSRSHPKFVSRLFEMEVPEINEGLVEIKSIAREAGSRTKIAVVSNQEEIDPVGSLVGQKGTRVAAVIDEIGGEKIDIIEYSEEPAKFVAKALGPAKVDEVEIIPDKREVRVFVPPTQLSLAIGRNGQNVRLAAKLTSWRIDVRSSMEPEKSVEGGRADIEEAKEDMPEKNLSSSSDDLLTDLKDKNPFDNDRGET